MYPRNDFLKDAARVKCPASRSGSPRCPLCGAHVLYQGLSSLECAGGVECPNAKAPPPPLPGSAKSDASFPRLGSTAWARSMTKTLPGSKHGKWEVSLRGKQYIKADPHDLDYDWAAGSINDPYDWRYHVNP